MEVDSSVATPPPSDATNRRRSGRTVRQPVLFQQDPNVSLVPNGSSGAKRKRGERLAGRDENDEGTEDSTSDPAESEPDAEEIKEKRRRVVKPAKARDQREKPAATKKAKAPKSGGLKLPVRPATNGVKKPARPRKPASRKHLPQDLGSDLYGLTRDLR